jgi:hypothetical protein
MSWGILHVLLITGLWVAVVWLWRATHIQCCGMPTQCLHRFHRFHQEVSDEHSTGDVEFCRIWRFEIQTETAVKLKNRGRACFPLLLQSSMGKRFLRPSVADLDLGQWPTFLFARYFCPISRTLHITVLSTLRSAVRSCKTLYFLERCHWFC